MARSICCALTMVATLGLAGCGLIEVVSKPAPTPTAPPDITNLLLNLVTTQESYEIAAKDYSSTSLGALIQLGTPAGYRLKLRYEELGVSLVEALKASRDKLLLDRLFEIAQWGQRDKMRAESLITLAHFSDPGDLPYFKMALSDSNIGLRFAAIEALQAWGQPGSMELLTSEMNTSWSPLMRVFAAQAVLSLGEESGLPVLMKALEDRSWIVRAMAARYIGDYAKPDVSSSLLIALNQENDNDFVVAELAIAVLKLLSRVNDKVVYQPAARAWSQNRDVSYTVGKDETIEMEPLVILPPRIFLPDSTRIAQTVNSRLLTLIQSKLGVPLDPAQLTDPNRQDLFKMLTPTGFALQTRYSELSVLVAEGLGGTRDPILRTALARLAEYDSNPLVRATALLSLAYARNSEDIMLLQNNLLDSDPIVRFGALEAIQAGRFTQVALNVHTVATTDVVPAFQIFAIQVLTSLGDSGARNLLLSHLNDTDWPARAMATWYLGRYGLADDHGRVINMIASEDNPFVQAEIALAAQRLAPL